MAEKMDKELKDLAIDWAEKIYNNIYLALTDPSAGMNPETVRIYNELKDWGWFDLVDIDGDKSHEIILKLLAMPRYKQLLDHKKNPPLSKWQKVMGNRPGSK